MKKIRKVLLLVLALILFSGLTNVKAEGKVKVYIFEAGGCPYCEKEVEYLQSLSSMIPALIVNPGEKENILDMCSAPGR